MLGNWVLNLGDGGDAIHMKIIEVFSGMRE